jgi:hypothetical protein
MSKTKSPLSSDIHRIALLIPCTSKNRDHWRDIRDSYLYNLTLKTFLLTQDKEHHYCFYVGYDHDDRIYSNKEEQQNISRFSSVFTNIEFKFIPFKDIPNGHITKMWNILYKAAYDDEYEFFFQCGDDINFKTKGWINACIEKLVGADHIGIAGPLNNNARILTQAMFTRKHMEALGFLFPEEIINWCCDDWYNYLYYPKFLFVLTNHICINEGGEPRYVINNNSNFKNPHEFKKNTDVLRSNAMQLAKKHWKIIETYMNTKIDRNIDTNYHK